MDNKISILVRNKGIFHFYVITFDFMPGAFLCITKMQIAYKRTEVFSGKDRRNKKDFKIFISVLNPLKI